MTDKMRKEFEIWAESRGLDLYCSRTNIYEETETLWAWSAWKASRSAIKLPKPHLEFEGDLAPEMFAREVYAAVGVEPC